MQQEFLNDTTNALGFLKLYIYINKGILDCRVISQSLSSYVNDEAWSVVCDCNNGVERMVWWAGDVGWCEALQSPASLGKEVAACFDVR